MHLLGDSPSNIYQLQKVAQLDSWKKDLTFSAGLSFLSLTPALQGLETTISNMDKKQSKCWVWEGYTPSPGVYPSADDFSKGIGEDPLF